jgi:hypothetical protein
LQGRHAATAGNSGDVAGVSGVEGRMAARYFSVKNFEQFQHYKSGPKAEGKPRWIKLYLSVLTDYDLSQLPDTAKAHLYNIWALAAELNNKIPWDSKWLAHKINASSPINLELLEQSGFITPLEGFSDTALEGFPKSGIEGSDESPSYLVSSNLLSGSEKSREKETNWPTDLDLDSEMVKYAHEQDIDPALEFAAWRDWCAAHPRKARYADWHAAWRTWCRNAVDFGRARSRASPNAATGVGMANLQRRHAEAVAEKNGQGQGNRDSGASQGQLVPAAGR